MVIPRLQIASLPGRGFTDFSREQLLKMLGINGALWFGVAAYALALPALALDGRVSRVQGIGAWQDAEKLPLNASSCAGRGLRTMAR